MYQVNRKALWAAMLVMMGIILYLARQIEEQYRSSLRYGAPSPPLEDLIRLAFSTAVYGALAALLGSVGFRQLLLHFLIIYLLHVMINTDFSGYQLV